MTGPGSPSLLSSSLWLCWRDARCSFLSCGKVREQTPRWNPSLSTVRGTCTLSWPGWPAELPPGGRCPRCSPRRDSPSPYTGTFCRFYLWSLPGSVDHLFRSLWSLLAFPQTNMPDTNGRPLFGFACVALGWIRSICKRKSVWPELPSFGSELPLSTWAA